MSSQTDLLQGQIVELLPKLRRFARALTRDRHDADDLLQAAIERGLTHLAQWQEGSRLDCWLYRIVRNTWIDELRSRRRQGRVFAKPRETDAVADAAGDASAMLAVEQALGRLPDDQRLAVALVLVEGLPYKEAAQIIGIPIGTLTSRLARGREALQELLEPGDAA